MLSASLNKAFPSFLFVVVVVVGGGGGGGVCVCVSCLVCFT